MYCQKIFIIFYLILTNKFLLKRTKIKNILQIISVHERLGVASKQKEIYRYRLKLVEKYWYFGCRQISIIVHPYLKINCV